MGTGVRRIAAVLLVIVTSISALVATLGVWTNSNVLDSTRFAVRGAEILAQPEVADAVATRLTDQTVGLLSRATGRDLDGRAGDLIRSALNERFSRRLTDLDTARITYPALLAAHSAVVRSIESEQQAVTLDLLPLITTVLTDLRELTVLPSWMIIPNFTLDENRHQQVLRLSEALRVELPDELGRITLIEADPSRPVVRIRELLRVFHDVVVWALVASVALALAAVLVSPRKSRTIIHLGIGCAIAWTAGVIAVDQLRYFVSGMMGSTDREAVEVALRLFLVTWTDLSIRLILFAVGLSAVGIMTNIREGLRWIPALIGLAVAATMRLSPLGVLVGAIVAVAGSVLLTAMDRTDLENIRSAD